LVTSKRIKYKIMKTKKKLILIVFLLFTLMQNINAQIFDFIPKPLEQWGNNGPPTPGYYKDINGHFNKFIGTWEYSSSDRYLKVQFYKVEKISIWDNIFLDDDFVNDLFRDMLFSFVEYKEKQNGQWITIYNTFGTQPINVFSYHNRGREIEGGHIINSNFIFLGYSEPLSEECKKLRGTLNLKYQAESNPPQISWERDPVIYVTDRPRKCVDIEEESFKIPANLVLTKITN